MQKKMWKCLDTLSVQDNKKKTHNEGEKININIFCYGIGVINV